MRRQTSEWSVRMLADLRGRISTDAEYQRGAVWSTPQQLLLVDSILRGFDLPKIFLRKLPDGSPHLFEVVDGVQRLTAIWSFLNDEIRLPRSAQYADTGKLGGKLWSELPQDAKDKLQFAKVTVSELEDYSDDDIRELFQRLQKGEPLNSAERRNAVASPVRNFVADVMSVHPLWPETMLKSKRFGWHEMSAIVLALVLADGPTGLKGADLGAIYEVDGFDPDGPDATRALDLMQRLYEIASQRRGAIKTRWGVVDLLLALMRLDTEGITPSPSKVMDFFEEFEAERRSGAVALADLRSSIIDLAADEAAAEELDIPGIAPDMLSYLSAFSREGATSASVAIRAEVMTNRLRRYLQAHP